MEEMLYKFINEGRLEHKEIGAFIREFKTTNELLLKERNNSLSELEFEVYGLSKAINNSQSSNYKVKGVTTRRGKTTTEISRDANNVNKEPPILHHEKPVEPNEVLKEKEEAQQRKLEEACTVTINERCSVVLLNKLPSKEKDPRSFTIPCDIGHLHIHNALADLGASISLMPYTMYEKLGLGEPKPTRISLELADRSIQYLRGIAENVHIKIDKFILPINFVILDMREDSKILIILGRPFLATARAMINVFNKKITLRVGNEEESIDLSDLKNYGKANDIVESWTPIRRIEEVNTPYSRGTERTDRAQNEHLYSASTNKIDEKRPVLKDLPSHLEYAYLKGDESCPIIISSKLTKKEKISLLQVLEKCKGAIAWKITSGTQRFSNAKATNQTECQKCGKKGHFARGCWSKASVPSYQSPFQTKPLSSSQHKPELRPTKDFEAKYNKVKAKLTLLSSSALAFKAATIKNKGLIAEAYEWDEEEVSLDDNEMVEVKVLMALAEENDAISKEGARNGKWVKISMRKVHTLVEMEDNDDRKTYLDYLILLAESQRNTIDPSVAITDSLATDYDLADEFSVCSTPLPLLKKLDGVIINEPSSALAKGNKSSSASKVHSAPARKLKSVKIKDDHPLAIVLENALQNIYKTQFKKSCDLCGLNNHLSENCYKDLFCKRYEKNDHRTCDHPEYISTMNMSRPLKSLADHYDIEWFKRGDALQAKKAEALKSTIDESSNTNRSKTPTRSQLCDAKYIVQFDKKRGTIFNSNKEVVMIAPRVRDVYVLDMTSSAQESCFFAKASENLNWLWHKRLAHLNFKTINKLAKQNLVIGLPSLVYSKDKPCSSCEKGKHHRASFKTKQTSSIKKCLHLLHMDLFGPVTPSILVNFYDEKGISQNFSSPYTPEQNSVAERKNKTLIEAARTLLSGSVFSKQYWTEAVATACYTQNRSTIVKRHLKTPYEIFRTYGPLFEGPIPITRGLIQAIPTSLPPQPIDMEDDVDISALTIEQYIALIPDDIKPDIVNPKIGNDVEFDDNAN
ncbi:retrovirus-related pol polyprotein from transposon TNT 1-94 [Tanacetum coccineum]